MPNIFLLYQPLNRRAGVRAWLQYWIWDDFDTVDTVW